ncbi:MAG: ATP-binding protein [Fimbriimonadales bacterium]|nr:ATP-binding protein [Fimbriimonadales bacterium]
MPDHIPQEVQLELESLRQRVAELEHALEVQEWGGQLFHESNIPQMLLDFETGTILVANAAAQQFYGEHLKQPSQHNIEAICAEGLKWGADLKPLVEQYRYGVRLSQQYNARGEMRSVDVHFVLVNLRGRPVVHLISFDVTDLQEVQRALQRSEERYRLFVQLASEGIWQLDLHPPVPIALPAEQQVELIFERARISECNSAFARMHDALSSDVLAGVAMKTLFPPTESQNREMVEAFVRNGHRLEGFLCQRCAPSGGERHYLISLVGIVEDGMLVGAWGLQTDITELRRLQQELDRAYRVESLGRLAGGIAHDFNNVLTAILGFAELARGRTQDETLLRYLDGIIQAAERATQLNQQLLAYARRQVIKPMPMDLRVWMANVETILRRVLPENIRLTIEVAPDLGQILGDPNLLLQIVLNLVVNARDAMPHGGTLTIRLLNKTVRRSAEIPPGQYVVLSVADTGTGIPPEVMPHIFEPFFTTKPTGQGTGLGLAAVQGAVQQLNGFIQVESHVGKGTGFTVYFPRLRPPKPPREAGNTPVGPLQ